MKSQFNHYFPVLSVISILLRVLGWFSVISGVLSLFIVLSLVIGDSEKGIFLISSAVSVLSGLVAVAIGEVIGVLFAIEANTRKAAEAMQVASSTVPVQRQSDNARLP